METEGEQVEDVYQCVEDTVAITIRAVHARQRRSTLETEREQVESIHERVEDTAASLIALVTATLLHKFLAWEIRLH